MEILVTDAVAVRLLDARCTGVAFSDPTTPQSGKRIVRVCTLDGVGERHIGF